MDIKNRTVFSTYDGLALDTAFFTPVGNPKAIICFSHGMAEHKERYFNFMKYLCKEGYICVIHDHRGHGKSVISTADYGYFYTKDSSAIVEDLHTVIDFAKAIYPDLPVYIFSHSMGTLVARCFLKKYDDLVEKVVLCGPPTRNDVVGIGLFLAQAADFLGKSHDPNKFLSGIAFNGFNKDSDVPNSWLSVNPDNVKAYNEDPLCGYTFTTNGFINLFKLQRDSFISKDWEPKNPDLHLFLIAGSDDPCIGSEELFTDLALFLELDIGYHYITRKLYPGKRHELLNEYKNAETYNDVLCFYNFP